MPSTSPNTHKKVRNPRITVGTPTQEVDLCQGKHGTTRIVSDVCLLCAGLLVFGRTTFALILCNGLCFGWIQDVFQDSEMYVNSFQWLLAITSNILNSKVYVLNIISNNNQCDHWNAHNSIFYANIGCYLVSRVI